MPSLPQNRSSGAESENKLGIRCVTSSSRGICLVKRQEMAVITKHALRISLGCFLWVVAAGNACAQETQPASTVAATGSSAKSSKLIATVERAIVDQTNEFRKSNELAIVERDEHLTQAAKKFAEFMASTGKYGHHADGMTPSERAEAAGYEYCVVRENIAYRTNSGEVTSASLIDVFVQGWFDSPPHRESMLADYVTHTGVAVATTDDVTYYAVQMFGRPKAAAFNLMLKNESGETKVVALRANDQQDEFELPPRMILKMTRCFPTEVSVAGSDVSKRINSDANLTVTTDGLVDSED